MRGWEVAALRDHAVVVLEGGFIEFMFRTNL